MGVANFKTEDLTARNLQTLILELRTEISNGHYKEVGDFAKAFASKVSGMEIKVEDGKRTLEVGAERVDFNEAVKAINAEIEASKTVTLTGTEKTARDAMYVEVDKQLTALFKQTEMMDALIAKGFSPADFYAQTEKSNKISDERIKRLDETIKDTKKEKTKVLGEDFKDPDPLICKKSLSTKLQDEKDAKKYLENIKGNLEEIKALEDASKQMEAEIATDPTKESMYRGNIDEIKRKVSQLSINIDGNVKSIQDLRLTAFDDKSLNKCQDPTVMTRDEALAAVTTLYGTSPDGHIMEGRIDSAYSKIADAMLDSKKGNIKDPLKSIVEKMKSGATPTQTEKDDAKKAIDEYVAEFDKTISSATKAKTKEEILKVARTESVADYKARADKLQTLNDKFNKVNVQSVDADGNPLFLNPDGTETTTDTGTPKTEERLEPKSATVTDYLSDFDEAGKKSAIETAGKAKISAMKYNDRRNLLKEAGIGNAFTRLFRAMRVDPSNTRLLDKATETERAQLDTDKKSHLDAKFSQDKTALEENQTIVSATQREYEIVSKTAPVQQRMQDGAYKATDTRTDLPELISAMQSASYEEISLILARGVLTGDKLAKLEEARKEYNFRQVVDRQATQRGVDVSKNPKTPVHTDEESR